MIGAGVHELGGAYSDPKWLHQGTCVYILVSIDHRNVRFGVHFIDNSIKGIGLRAVYAK